jgi:predicted Zn-dependent protease
MKLGDIEIVATWDADRTTYCPKCGNFLRQVDNGWFNSVLYCPKDDIFFEVKLIKMREKNINKEAWNKIRKQFSPTPQKEKKI